MNPSAQPNKYLKKLFWNLLKLPLPAKWRLDMRFYNYFGRFINWSNPLGFNEKIQYLKLYDRKPEYGILADKYAVKEWVAKKIGAEYIVPNYGVWERAEDIDFDLLPQQFVIKCNHDSGSVFVVKDKSKADLEAIRQSLKEHLAVNYANHLEEWVYSQIKPCVLAEKYLEVDDPEDGLIDYKFFCFDGKPAYLYLVKRLGGHDDTYICFLNTDWTWAPFQRKDYQLYENPPKPACLDKMLQIAAELSQGHPFLRVDLYCVKGQIYFSELTFYPTGGFILFENVQMDEMAGAALTIFPKPNKSF
jgi:hypothetical protein